MALLCSLVNTCNSLRCLRRNLAGLTRDGVVPRSVNLLLLKYWIEKFRHELHSTPCRSITHVVVRIDLPSSQMDYLVGLAWIQMPFFYCIIWQHMQTTIPLILTPVMFIFLLHSALSSSLTLRIHEGNHVPPMPSPAVTVPSYVSFVTPHLHRPRWSHGKLWCPIGGVCLWPGEEQQEWSWCMGQ